MISPKCAAVRESSVIKSNDLIQKSRFFLSLQQQKIILFLISQIDPQDSEFKLYTFSISDFCKVCGIDYDSGGNHSALKEQIKKLADKSLWVTLPNGNETLLRWIEKPYISTADKTIKIKLDNDMKPYLLQLKSRFTRYELVYTLHFDSKYSIRLYELVKSVHFNELREYKKAFTVDEIAQRLGAEQYKEYRDLKRRAILPAVREINEHSDKNIEYTEIKDGKKVTGVVFTISTKCPADRLHVFATICKDTDK